MKFTIVGYSYGWSEDVLEVHCLRPFSSIIDGDEDYCSVGGQITFSFTVPGEFEHVICSLLGQTIDLSLFLKDVREVEK